jgi:hypothetical protein
VNPVNNIIVTRLDNTASGTATMVFKIPETVAEHNVVVELLRRVKHEYPGAWFQFEQELLSNRRELVLSEKVKPLYQKDDEETGVSPIVHN